MPWDGRREPSRDAWHAPKTCSARDLSAAGWRRRRRGWGPGSAEARTLVPGPLQVSTVRAAVAAGLAGMEASLVSGSAAVLARGVLSAMLLGRIKAVVPLLLLCVGTAVVGAPLFRDIRPAGLPEAARTDRSLVRPMQATETQPTSFVGVAFTADGKNAISARAGGLVQFWDSSTGQSVRSLALLAKEAKERGSLRGFALSPDGTRLAGVGSVRDPSREQPTGVVWIGSTDKGELLRRITVDSAVLECLAFSPEGASLATGDRAGLIRLWDVTTGDEVLTLRLGHGVIRWIAFSPDGMTLAASDEASGLQLWSLAAGRALGVLAEGTPRGVLAPVFSPDGRLLAFGTSEGELIVWDRAGTPASRPPSLTGKPLPPLPSHRMAAHSQSAGGWMESSRCSTRKPDMSSG